MLFSDLFTDDHIVANMFIFYNAGSDSTSATLTWIMYELALNPEIQEKLREEIMKAREANNGILDYTSISKIEYLEMVISGMISFGLL